MLSLSKNRRLRELGWAVGGCVILALVAGAEPARDHAVEQAVVIAPPSALERVVPAGVLVALPPAEESARSEILAIAEEPVLPPVVESTPALGQPAALQAPATEGSIVLAMPLTVRPAETPQPAFEPTLAEPIEMAQAPPNPSLLLTPEIAPDPILSEAPLEDPQDEPPPLSDPAAGYDIESAPPQEPLPLAVAPTGASSGCPCSTDGAAGANAAPGCSRTTGCHESPNKSFPSRVHCDILDMLAVDIARRTLLAIHPYAAKNPIITLDVIVRPQGHEVHTFVTLQWRRQHWWQSDAAAKIYTSEVSASVLYHPDKRQVFDLSYVDNAWLPFRDADLASQIVASYNEDFALRDATGQPPKFLSDRIDVLEPYQQPRIFNRGPTEEPDPGAKSLRVVRRDSNVTANQ